MHARDLQQLVLMAAPGPATVTPQQIGGVRPPGVAVLAAVAVGHRQHNGAPPPATPVAYPRGQALAVDQGFGVAGTPCRKYSTGSSRVFGTPGRHT
jgi:hypothetical protein